MAMSMSTTKVKEKEGRIEGSAKAHVADQISQAVQSTSNLLHLMHQSSPSQALLIKLPKNLLAKASTVKNTGQVWRYLCIEDGLFSSHMKTSLSRASFILMDFFEQVLERMPRVISSLDAHMENGLRNVPHLHTVVQLLSNMETCQLNSASHAHRPREEEPS